MGKRPAPSRSSTCSATPPTSTASRSATPATSPRTGRGYCEYHHGGCPPSCPACSGFQAAGAAPIVEGHIVEDPQTVATAIRIGNPASWYGATAAASESGGGILAVTDEEILAAYKLLATEESVFCEAASAASVAGLLKVGVPPGSTVVCVLTGHGLKDPGPRHQPDLGSDHGGGRIRRRARSARDLTRRPAGLTL